MKSTAALGKETQGMVFYEIGHSLKVRKIEDLLDLPKVLLVNDFTEESAKAFRKEFDAAVNTGQKVIPILIDSYGGQVYSLMSMIATIKNSPVDVATICSGKAMSCGGILLSCGKEGLRFMDPLATVMIHDVSSMAWGKLEEMKTRVGEAERLSNIVFKMMAQNIGKPDDFFLRLLDEKKHADYYASPEDCKAMNLVNHIRIPSFKVKVSSEIHFS
jgi:ATP-dependent Clp endopeptidase proteolytic subunit ClpP